MKCLILSLALLICPKAAASVIVLIDVTTSEKGVNYHVNGQKKELAEVQAFFVEVVKAGDKDPVYIRPDRGTSFHDVYAVLQRLKLAGVDHMEVMAGTAVANAEANDLWLSIRAKNLRHEPDHPAKDLK